MVATTKIIRPKKSILGAVNQVIAYYFSYLHTANPGLTHNQVQPKWRGSGAVALGLTTDTVVTKDAVKNMMLGKSPDGQTQLWAVDLTEQADINPANLAGDQQEQRCKHVPAIDVCLSPPKSVSVLWQASPAHIREIILACLMNAVDKFIQNLESEGLLVRRGKQGVIKQHAKLAITSFLHSMSRENEPQLHIHLLISAICQSAVDQRWSKIDTRELLRLVPKLAALFNNDLLYGLNTQLGLTAHRPLTAKAKWALATLQELLGSERTDNFRERLQEIAQEKAGWFELDGVLESLCAARRRL